MKEAQAEYSNGELTVVWKPKLCIHAEECVNALPQVYKPDERPWINVENASTDQLINQIKKCPSGALSYYMNGEKDDASETSSTKVEILENGPLLVHGTLKVLDKDGTSEKREDVTAFCRCGASANKPYCDGTHTKVGFKG
ncbi:hypothetical protein E9993_20840 [Labilibacter sediminis]|nr:hypothetical protein E9993_20840 [Labilibacter sediminis]